MYDIFDNFLDNSVYNDIKSEITSGNFPWYWHPNQTDKDDTFFFFHMVYGQNVPSTNYWNKFLPIFHKIEDKIGFDSLINARLNLSTNTYGNGWCGNHRDQWTKNYIHKTAIMYFDSSNGKTILYPDGREGDPVYVDSKDNRIVVFDSSIWHRAEHQTDTERRIVLNINFIP